MAGSGDTSLARRACNCNGSRSYEVSGEGPLFSMSGGDARLAVGAGYRTNDYLNATYSSGVTYSGAENSRYGYGEMSLPLTGASSGASGTEALVLTSALPGVAYARLGSVRQPK